MPDDVVEYLAYSITSNVRELEGALISLLAQSSLNRKKITVELAKQMIDKFVKNTTREISVDFIQKVVCDYFDMPVELLKSKTRKREIVQARQLTMFFAKKMTKNRKLLNAKHDYSTLSQNEKYNFSLRHALSIYPLNAIYTFIPKMHVRH